MSKIQNLKFICFLAAAMNVSGCSLYSKDFDCKYDKGVGCKSITEINQMVDKGLLKGGSENKTSGLVIGSMPVINSDQGRIQRVQEEHLRVWIAPYQDEQGNFHEPSVIHTVIKPGFWQWLEKP